MKQPVLQLISGCSSADFILLLHGRPVINPLSKILISALCVLHVTTRTMHETARGFFAVYLDLLDLR